MSHPQFPREASAQRSVILERLMELLLLLALLLIVLVIVLLLLVIVVLLFKYIRQEPEINKVTAERVKYLL